MRSSGCSPPGADPVRKISIIPRGQSLGVTFSAPGRRPLQLLERASCCAKIKVALGGRVAEEIVFGEPSDRRRVGHPAADRDRPPDGRPLGHERRRSARSPCFPPTAPARCSRRGGGLAEDPAAGRRGGAPHRRRTRTSEVTALLTENRDRARRARAGAARARDARRGRRVRGRRHRTAGRRPGGRPRRCRACGSIDRRRRNGLAASTNRGESRTNPSACGFPTRGSKRQ